VRARRMGKQNIYPVLVVIALILSLFTGLFCLESYVIKNAQANPGNISEKWYNATTLNVTILYREPRINWYDFQYNQSGTWVSRRNIQSDVNNSAQYRFIVNISSDNGWKNITYINVTAWYDQGNDNTVYNQTLGGNLNLAFQYENLTGTAVWRTLWPHGGEITNSKYSERIVRDPVGSPRFTQCHNLTFSFVPGYQFRYAPGDGSWDTSRNATNDAQSWNFKISASNKQGYTSWIHDEFGIFSYTEIVSAGWPAIYGYPGQNATAETNITMVTRSNGNYSLSVDVGNLTHKTHPTANMSRKLIWVRGGDLDISRNFTTFTDLLYFYGSTIAYHVARANGTSLATSDIEYKCNIPLGQTAGEYTAPIRYHLKTT
jgi:hypothetical protein